MEVFLYYLGFLWLVTGLLILGCGLLLTPTMVSVTQALIIVGVWLLVEGLILLWASRDFGHNYQPRHGRESRRGA